MVGSPPISELCMWFNRWTWWPFGVMRSAGAVPVLAHQSEVGVGEGRTRSWEQEVLQGCHENQGSRDWAAEGPRWASGRGCVTWVWSWGSRSAQGPAASLVLLVVRGAQSVPWKPRRAVEDQGPAQLNRPPSTCAKMGVGPGKHVRGAGRYGTLAGMASWEAT